MRGVRRQGDGASLSVGDGGLPGGFLAPAQLALPGAVGAMEARQLGLQEAGGGGRPGKVTIALGWDKRPGGVSGQAGGRPRLSSRGSGVRRREVTAKIPVAKNSSVRWAREGPRGMGQPASQQTLRQAPLWGPRDPVWMCLIWKKVGEYWLGFPSPGLSFPTCDLCAQMEAGLKWARERW